MRRRISQRDQTLIGAMNDLLRASGADPDVDTGARIREIIHTALKLVRDEADEGELKLISRSVKELRYALKVFRSYRDVRKISIFGSARTPEDDPDYGAALEFGRKMAEKQWMIITGAGDGIMRAGHGGAGREASFGVAIRLPFETNANEYIEGDSKLVTFRYFFTRKLMFMWQAHAVALFPGGFGTQDEGFEALTLVQTGKAPMVPILMVEAPVSRGGREYWKYWDNYVRKSLLANGLISPDDLHLYFITDDVDAAVDHVLHFYRNYHSQRYVRDTLVFRIQRLLTDEQIASLNHEFGDLVRSGRIEQGPALPEEIEQLDLPRIHFVHEKRAYGRQRLMIDRINDYDKQNHPQIG